MDFTIYVPTMGRVGKQITAEGLRGSTADRSRRVVLVTPEAEAAALAGAGWPMVQPVPASVRGIGPTRQWIYENHDTGRDGRYLFMMDDDLRFFRRRYDDPTKFLRLETPAEVDLMLGRLEAMLRQVPLAGLDNRSGANRRVPPVQNNGRMHDVQCVDVEVARQVGIRFDRIRFMEDFQVVLEFLTRGYPTALLTTHCKDDIGSNTAGGCSLYRDSEGQAEAAHALREMYPGFVRLTTRPGWAGEMSLPRTDVQVQWKKAYEAGVVGRDLIGLEPWPEPDWEGLAPDWEIF